MGGEREVGPLSTLEKSLWSAFLPEYSMGVRFYMECAFRRTERYFVLGKLRRSTVELEKITPRRQSFLHAVMTSCNSMATGEILKYDWLIRVVAA